jgi:hypothetical protein
MKDNKTNSGYQDEIEKGKGQVSGIIYGVLSAISITVQVFFRKDFGERYLSIFRFITLVVLFYLFSVFYSKIFDPSIFIFLTCFTLLYIVHFFMIKIRPYEKEVHSHYAGTSRFKALFPFFSENFVKMYVEPLFCMIIGIALFFVYLKYYDVLGLSLYLFFAGLILFFQAQVESYFLKEHFLDLRDEVIESGQVNEVFINLKEPSKTKGFTVGGLQKVPLQERQKLAEMYKNINPHLRAIEQIVPINHEFTKLPETKDTVVKEKEQVQEK